MGLKKKTNLNYEIVLISAPGTLFIAERTSTKFEIVSLHYALILQSVQCFKMKFTGIGLLALIFCHLSTFGQVRKLALITDRNFNQISFLDQLKFIEKAPAQLQKLMKRLQDSDNSMVLDSAVEQIVALQTPESFLLIANFCCRYIDKSRQSEFTRMALKINRQAAYKALNKYYLENFYEPGFHPVLYHALIYESIRERYKSVMDASSFYTAAAPRLDQKKSENDCFQKIQINDQNINFKDHGFYKFEFLNSPPQNRLDSLVNKINRSVLELREKDTISIKLLIDSIGQLRTQSAYCYLYTFAVRKRWSFSDDLNPLDGIVERFGGLKAINNYFLNGKLTQYLDKNKFDPDAEKILKENAPLCFYCAQDTTADSKGYFMRKLDTRFQDEKIIETINYFSDLNKYGGFEKYPTALDSISAVIGQMTFVADRKYNLCSEVPAKFPGEITLGVLINSSEGAVEKTYKIQLGCLPAQKKYKPEDLNQLKFISSAISPGFITAARAKCGDKDE